MPKTIKKLVDKTRKLLRDFAPANVSDLHLKDRIIHAYHLFILSQLNTLFEKYETNSGEAFTPDSLFPEEILCDLRACLEDNWKLICNTYLSYTALPKSEITAHLCALAETLAFEINQKNPDQHVTSLQLLIPTLSTDSIDTNYPDLSSPNIEKPTPWTKANLLKLFETHICGEDGLYLIPIQLLLDKKHHLIHEKIYQNPYFNYRKHDPIHINLSSSEQQRLVQHSRSTIELEEVYDEYESYFKGTDNLLNRLYKLCEKLRFNSTQGIGKEFDAGISAYAAILDFEIYFSSIKEEINNFETFPKKLYQEIELLLDLSSNPQKNTKAEEVVETCIASRRMALEEAIQGNETLLASIAVKEIDKKNLIEQIKKDLNKAEVILRSALSNHSYTGVDSLPCTLKIIQNLNVTLQFSTIDDLELIKNFTPYEIHSLLKQEYLDQIIRCFKRFDDIILLCYDLNLDQCQAFFENLALYSNFWESLLERFQERSFSNLLVALDYDRCKIVASSMKKVLLLPPYNKLSTRIIFNSLTPKYREMLFPLYKNELINCILSASNFNTVLSYFEQGKNERIEIYESCKNKLSVIINKGSDFKDILQHLNLAQREEVFDQYKINLSYLFISAQAFGDILDYLNPLQRLEIYEQHKNQLNSFISNTADLAAVLKNLTFEQGIEICNRFEYKLLHFLENDDDFINEVREMSSDQRQIIYTFYKKNIYQSTRNIENFRRLISPLPPNELKDILDHCSDRLAQLIFSIKDYIALHPLDLKFHQNAAIFSMIHENLLDMIDSAETFTSLFENLMIHQRECIFIKYKHKISDLIHSAEDFNLLFRYLTSEQRGELLIILKDDIPFLINNGFELGLILQPLTFDQRKGVYNWFENNLSSLINSSEELCVLLSYATFEQQLSLVRCLPIGKFESYFQTSHVQKNFFIYFEELDYFIRCAEILPPPQLKILLNHLLSNPDYKHCITGNYNGISHLLSACELKLFLTIYHSCKEFLDPGTFNQFNFSIREELVRILSIKLIELDLNDPEIKHLRNWIEQLEFTKSEFILNHNWKYFLERCFLLQKDQINIEPPRSFLHFFFPPSEITSNQKILKNIQLTLEKISSLIPTLNQVLLFNTAGSYPYSINSSLGN